ARYRPPSTPWAETPRRRRADARRASRRRCAVRVTMSPRQRPADRARRLTPRRSPVDNVRAAAAWVLERTLAASSPVDVFLAGSLERFDERDQALLRELVLGSLRWLRRIDHVLAAASARRLADIDPALHGPLRVAIYQLLFLDRVPPYAAVDEAVEEAQQR